MESKPVDTSDTTTYWIKLLISAIFGMFTYYLLTYLPPLQFLEGNWGTTLSFFLFFIIYISCLIVIPFLFLVFKTNETFKQSLKIALFKNMGTSMALYLLLCTINFVLNIR